VAAATQSRRRKARSRLCTISPRLRQDRPSIDANRRVAVKIASAVRQARLLLRRIVVDVAELSAVSGQIGEIPAPDDRDREIARTAFAPTAVCTCGSPITVTPAASMFPFATMRTAVSVN
jgi:hypothetical protein